jgi:hypothetical protein
MKLTHYEPGCTVSEWEDKHNHLGMLVQTHFFQQSVMRCQWDNVQSQNPGEGTAGSSAISWESWKQDQCFTFTVRT